MQDEIVDLILESIKELGSEESWEIGDVDVDTKLFGEGGILDSMALVTLVVAVEQEIEDKYEQAVSLADEKAMSQSRSPYRSVSRLAEYAASQIESS